MLKRFNTIRRATLSDHAFPVAAVQAWNSLPPETRACSSLLTFQRETKSHLFRQSYGWLGAVHSDGQQTFALSCATVLDVDFVKCPRNCVMAALHDIHDICSSSSCSRTWQTDRQTDRIATSILCFTLLCWCVIKNNINIIWQCSTIFSYLFYFVQWPNTTFIQQEVKVIWQKAPHGGPIPRLGVTPGGRKLYYWIPGVGFPISVP